MASSGGGKLAYWVDMVACKEGLGGCSAMAHVQAHPVLQKVDKPTHICINHIATWGQ